MGHPLRIRIALVACVFAGLATAQAQTFSDISAGLDPVHHGTSTWVDYDNDGDLDIFLNGQTTNLSYITRLYNNNAGTFTLVTGTGLPDLGSSSHISRSAWGDFDGDGYADVVMTGFSGSSNTPVTVLYRNNSGNGTFTQVTVTPGFPGVFWGSTAWGDYDNDGDLDLLVTGDGGSGSRIATVFRNDGSASTPPSPTAWTFTDIDPLNIVNPSFNYITKVLGSSGAWGDYDRDGDLDLVLIGYTGTGAYSRTMVYRNDGGALVNANVNANTTPLVDLADGDAAWGDYNGDGYLDLALMGHQSATNVPSNTKHLLVYRNNQDGSFSQVFAYYAGFTEGSVAWGDADNDGHLDLLVTGSSTSWNTPATTLFHGDGAGGFSPVPLAGLDNLYEGQAVWGDYNNDGKLDILLSGRGSANNSTTTKVFKSNALTANTAPIRPLSLSSHVTASTIQVTWDDGDDAETDKATLVYNLSIRENVSGSALHVPPMADATTGYRRLVQLGNANHQKEWSIGGLQPTTTYRVCVQTIDQGFMASAFRCQTIDTADPGEEPEIIVRECGPTSLFTSPFNDDGSEPSIPNCGTKYWVSPDIWIRNNNDGQLLYQEPIFGQDNFIYVHLKNIGNMTLPAGTVHVYFAKPHTSAPWPKDWAGKYNSAGVLEGDFIGQATVENIAPGATFDAVVRWQDGTIPDPDDFTDEYANHFCLLARFTATSDPMSHPETEDTGENVKYNNNIASLNIYIFKPGSHKKAQIRFGRPLNVDALTSLKFEAAQAEDGSGDHALKHVSLKVTLPQELYDRWADNGKQGRGISTKEAGENSFFVTDPQAAIEGLRLNPDEEFVLEVEVSYPKDDPTAAGVFPLHMIQEEGDRVIGGETLQIYLSDKEK
jgi:hypothetical protein